MMSSLLHVGVHSSLTHPGEDPVYREYLLSDTVCRPVNSVLYEYYITQSSLQLHYYPNFVDKHSAAWRGLLKNPRPNNYQGRKLDVEPGKPDARDP